MTNTTTAIANILDVPAPAPAVIAEGKYFMPDTIWHGGSKSDMEAMGLVPTGVVGSYQTSEYSLPAGWAVVESGVSYFQRRLVDDRGNVRAKLFYKPGSQAGRPEMELTEVGDGAASAGDVTAYLPAKVWYGSSLADLYAFGVKPTGKTAMAGLNQIVECALPLGWRVVPSDESIFQTRLVDALGRVRAKIFSQPGSAGGGMEMEIVPVTLH